MSSSRVKDKLGIVDFLEDLLDFSGCQGRSKGEENLPKEDYIRLYRIIMDRMSGFKGYVLSKFA